MTSKAGRASCVSPCPQLWAHGLVPSRHSGYSVVEQKKGDHWGKTERQPGQTTQVCLCFKTLNCCLGPLSQDKEKVREAGEVVQNMPCLTRPFSDTGPSGLSSICFSASALGFPHWGYIYLALLCPLLYISIVTTVTPCHNNDMCSSPLPPCHPDSELLEGVTLSSSSGAQCLERGLAHQSSPSRAS